MDLFTGLTGLPPQTLPWTVLGLMVLLVLTGWVPTRRELRDSQAREVKAMELADKWQKVATEHGMTLSSIGDAVEAIGDAVETTNAIVIQIQAGLERGTDGQ